MRNDRSFAGYHYYASVYEWLSAPNPYLPGGTDCVTYILANIAGKFETIYVPVTSLDSEGNEVKEFINIGILTDNFLSDFVARYQDRFFAMPLYPGNADGQRYSIARLANTVKRVWDSNKYKYLKLMESLGYEYNPINNYDMTETQEAEFDKSGTNGTTHTAGADGVEYAIDSPHVSLSGSTGSNVDVAVWESTAKDEKTVNITTPVSQKHYTTTSESAATGRLEYYDVNDTGKTTEQEHKTPNAKVTRRTEAGWANNGTSTEGGTSGWTLTRSGNIGVTTSQQMIESQRNLVRFSIEDEIFADLEKEILLGCW